MMCLLQGNVCSAQELNDVKKKNLWKGLSHSLVIAMCVDEVELCV